MPSPKDLLLPGGKPLGNAGSRPEIRELTGGQKAAEDLFDELAVGGTPVGVPSYPGKMVVLPGGGRIGLRPVSKSGPPTIDVDVSGIPIDKLKFLSGAGT